MLLYTRFRRESLEGLARYIGSGFLSRMMMLLYKDDYRNVRSNELEVSGKKGKEQFSFFFLLFVTEKELNKNRKLTIVRYIIFAYASKMKRKWILIE